MKVLQYLYLMSEANKNANKSFLDKFQGKTNKISKLGVNSVLTGNDETTSKQDEHLRKVDLDSIIPNNPEKRSVERLQKRTQNLSKPLSKS